jgi:hypothetical protein
MQDIHLIFHGNHIGETLVAAVIAAVNGAIVPSPWIWIWPELEPLQVGGLV